MILIYGRDNFVFDISHFFIKKHFLLLKDV